MANAAPARDAERVSARPLRILNVAEAPRGRTRVSPSARGLAASDLSLTPCAECDGRCCFMRIVVSTVDALRVSRALAVPLLSHLQAVPWSRELTTTYAWPFKLDDGGRHVFTFRRTPGGGCVHLAADGRCGAYADRPSNCRLYPFVLEDERGVIPAGSQEHCPVQWLQNDELRGSLAADVARYREQRELDVQVVRFWNRGRRARSLAALAAWLEDHVAAELGLGGVAPTRS